MHPRDRCRPAANLRHGHFFASPRPISVLAQWSFSPRTILSLAIWHFLVPLSVCEALHCLKSICDRRLKSGGDFICWQKRFHLLGEKISPSGNFALAFIKTKIRIEIELNCKYEHQLHYVTFQVHVQCTEIELHRWSGSVLFNHIKLHFICMKIVHCTIYIALKLNGTAQMIRLSAHQPPFKSNAEIASVPSTHCETLTSATHCASLK